MSRKILIKIEELLLRLIQGIGSVSILFGRTIKAIFEGQVSAKLVYQQMVRIGVDSLPVALVTAAFVGMVFAVQIAAEFVKFGAGKMVGGVMAIAVARELAPALTGVVIAARVGAAIAAEIGTMKVTQQIDALYALGSNPVKYLIAPRLLACTLMLPLLVILADVVGFIGGYLVAVYLVRINPVNFMITAEQMLKMNDLVGGILKALFFGMIVAMIACYKGLNTKTGAKGVGEATTNSVVTTLITIFIINYFLSVALFK